MTSPWYTYILRCTDDSLYTGVTTDLDRRLGEHNAGTASKYTRARLPARMIWHELAKSESAAKKREAAIKKMTRKEKEELVRGGFVAKG
jgi:putative endonuclease